MATFADLILTERNFDRKVELMEKLASREEITFNNGIIFKALIVKLFVETMKIDVDINEIVTAALLCMCKKVENSQDIQRIESYAEESAKYLKTLGFSKRFCMMCEQHNRYSGNQPRLTESQILEIADQLRRNANV